MLFTAEERYYTDLYLCGCSASGAALRRTSAVPGWRQHQHGNPAGCRPGLRPAHRQRALVVRQCAAPGHRDAAEHTPEIQRVQFLVTTKTSF